MTALKAYKTLKTRLHRIHKFTFTNIIFSSNNSIQYTDDTQLYFAVTPSEPNDQISALQSCLVSLQTWFCQNGMALNPDKSDAILIGTAQRALSYSNLTSVNVAGTTVPLVSNFSILGQ